MKFEIFLFLLLIAHYSFSQNIDIDENTQNKIWASGIKDSLLPPDFLPNSTYKTLSKTTQIPAYLLYNKYWDTLHLRSQILEIPFYENRIQFSLVAGSNHPFAFPCTGNKIMDFGLQKDRTFHPGIDYNVIVGDPIVSCFDGVVRIAANYGDYGNMVVIRHYNGLESVYAHLDKLFVHCGQIVNAGDLIGYAGKSGNTEIPILHFELRFMNEFFNPEAAIDNTTRKLTDNTLTLHPDDFYITPLPISTNNQENEEDQNTGTAHSQPVYHIIKQGETLYRIARMYNVSVESIIKINKLSANGDDIRAGQKIKIR